MRNIVIYGDSNTWGFEPAVGRRYPHDQRWGGVLRHALGSAYWVNEEGLNGRTTVHPDPVDGEYKNGYATLEAILHTHKPIDLLVFLLGTNDLKARFTVSPQEIAMSMGRLVKLAKRTETGLDGQSPRILLMAPAKLAPLEGTIYETIFGSQAQAKSYELGKYYREQAQLLDVDFIDVSEHVVSSTVDGIHWELSEHSKLGFVVAKSIQTIFGG